MFFRCYGLLLVVCGLLPTSVVFRGCFLTSTKHQLLPCEGFIVILLDRV